MTNIEPNDTARGRDPSRARPDFANSYTKDRSANTWWILAVAVVLIVGGLIFASTRETSVVSNDRPTAAPSQTAPANSQNTPSSGQTTGTGQ